MKEDKLSVTSLPENHLSIDQIYLYLDNKLPVADRHLVEQHLLDCDLCTDAMAGLSLTKKESTEHQLFQINYQLKNRVARRKPNTILQNLKNWGITTIFLFIIILAALLVWYQVKQAAGNKKNNYPPAGQIKTHTSLVDKKLLLSTINIFAAPSFNLPSAINIGNNFAN